jgi:hypothetical protein
MVARADWARECPLHAPLQLHPLNPPDARGSSRLQGRWGGGGGGGEVGGASRNEQQGTCGPLHEK